MVRKGVSSIEEEFKRYGARESDLFQEERVKAGPVKNQKNGLSKVIHILVILILVVILVILGKVGYMFFSNPSTLENVVQSGTKYLRSSVSQQSSTQVTPQVTKAVSKSSVAAIIQKPATQTDLEVASKVASSSAQTQSSESQKLQQQLAVALSQNSELQPQKSELSQMNALGDLSDEELVKLLLMFGPDQLEKLDIQKIFKEKSAKKAQASKVKVAKTEYLNNQAIITSKKKAAKNDELLKISQKVSSLLEKTETIKTKKITPTALQKATKVKSDNYLKGLQAEVKTREKAMRFYVVKEGDTLSKIAKSIYGKASAYVKIYEANQDIITNPRLIFPGQKLRIPEI